MNNVCATLRHCRACRRSDVSRKALFKDKEQEYIVCPKGWTAEKIPCKQAMEEAAKLITYKKENYNCCDKRRQKDEDND